MGQMPRMYWNGNYKNITFCVTEECNLRCKYCYMVHKNSFHRMSLETAKRAVDFFLDQPVEREAVVWDFIGGEPTLEIGLIDQISDYIKLQLFTRNHPWFDTYMFSIGTNGLLYTSDEVQEYIQKNRRHVAMAITIDGTKEKHDLQRVRPDGSGSYDTVLNSVQLWIQQYPNAATKVTFSSEDLKLLKDSIIHLWDIGLKMVPANLVFEDVWKENDDIVYEKQLFELADYIIEKKMWEDYSVRFFDPSVGIPLSREDKNANYCGTGKMVAVNCNGDLYPCIRFLDFCSESSPQNSLCTGNIQSGYNKNVLNTFNNLCIGTMQDEECNQCPIASGCFACAGNNYSCNESHSIFKKTKFHCKMQKAQVRAVEYFWNRVIDETHQPSPRETRKKEAFLKSGFRMDGAKYMYFILSNDIAPHCMYTPTGDMSKRMSQSTFELGMKYVYENHFIPVYLGNPEPYLSEREKNKFFIRIDDVASLEREHSNIDIAVVVPVYNRSNYHVKTAYGDACIISIKKSELESLADMTRELSSIYRRVNILKADVAGWDEIAVAKYAEEVKRIKSAVDCGEVTSSINIFSHPGDSATIDRCGAGTTEITFAPDGDFYICPAYYFKGATSIGAPEKGIHIPDAEIYSISKAPACSNCGLANCPRCVGVNESLSLSPNIPAEIICMLSKIESA